MGKMPALSKNGKRLIALLLSMPSEWITAVFLADSLGISRRTVMRELPDVERWFQAAEAEFQKSPGKGIKLSADETERDRLLTQLEGKEENISELSREERRKRLLVSLLTASEPVKTYALAVELGISESTLSSDLDQLSDWLKIQELKLVRKQGVGIYLEAEPARKRRAASRLLYEQSSREELTKAFNGVNDKKTIIDKLVDSEIASKVHTMLQTFNDRENLGFTDAGFLMLAIHLTLLVQQLQADRDYNKNIIIGSPVQPSELSVSFVKELEEEFSVIIPDDQIAYLSISLDAYRSKYPEEFLDGNEMDLRYLSSVMIQSVENDMLVDLSAHPTLAADLCNHLRPMLHRLRQGIQTDNPQLSLIMEQYAPLWEATRNACNMVEELEIIPDMPHIPDTEAGYLAMHFGAVIEQDTMARMRICVMVVCPYGMASSRFLCSQLIKEFPVVHIKGTGSVRELDPDKLRDDQIDLIISTVPLLIDFPNVIVEPVLQDVDKKKLSVMITKLQNDFKEKKRKNLGEGKNPGEKRIRMNERAKAFRYAAKISATIMELLDTMDVGVVDVPGNKETLIDYGAALFAQTNEEKQIIEDSILKREALGSTYVKPLRALLLHCKTKVIKGCRFGYLEAIPPVYENRRMIEGALVLLAGEEDEKINMQIMQVVSGILIDEPLLIERLRNQDKKSAASILESHLSEHFKNTITNTMK